MNNPFGHFTENGQAFEINTPDIPRNWYNYFFTDYYVTFTSQCAVGQGFLQDSLGRRLQCVGARGMYAVEGEKGWNLCGLPLHEKYDSYRCVHRRGATDIALEKNGIRSVYTLFVPWDSDPLSCCEVSMVEITTALVCVPPAISSTSASGQAQAFLIFSFARSQYTSVP